MPHRRPEQRRREREVLQGPAHEDAGRVDRAGQVGLAIREENGDAAPGQKARALEARQAGPHDRDVEGPHRTAASECLSGAIGEGAGMIAPNRRSRRRKAATASRRSSPVNSGQSWSVKRSSA